MFSLFRVYAGLVPASGLFRATLRAVFWGGILALCIAGPLDARAAYRYLPIPQRLLLSPPAIPHAAIEQESPLGVLEDPNAVLDLEKASTLLDGIIYRLAGGSARMGFYQEESGAGVSEIQALAPLYERGRTVVFTQFGAISIRDDGRERWAGNLGLGQRWFFAESQNPDRFFGYNAFLDHGFHRENRRGGLGAELRHDGLSFVSNYYRPLSGWQASGWKGWSGERPLEGWDAQLRSVAPFFPSLAVTGTYARWKKDPDDPDENAKPAIWSYGLEFTPHPVISGFISRRLVDERTKDFMFGLTFSWDMVFPWEKTRNAGQPAAYGTPAILPEGRDTSERKFRFIERNNTLEMEYSLDGK